MLNNRQKTNISGTNKSKAGGDGSSKDHLTILLVNGRWDCAGVSILLCKALNKYTRHCARHIVKIESIAQHETDITSKNYNLRDIWSILNIIDEADIIHFNYVDHTAPFFDINWSDFIKGKKLIFHDHSGWEPLKVLHNEYVSGQVFHKYDSYDQVIVCAPSDTQVFNNAIWLPNLMPIYKEDYLPLTDKSYAGTLIIGQSAVTQAVKSTDVLVQVVKELQKMDYNVDLDIITGLSHKECLERKKKHHIEFDNMYQGHHGMAGLEALSMGIPTLAWLKPEVIEAYEDFGEGSSIPIINVRDKDELLNALVKLIENRALLEENSIYCRQWIEKYYNEECIIKMYVDMYKSL